MGCAFLVIVDSFLVIYKTHHSSGATFFLTRKAWERASCFRPLVLELGTREGGKNAKAKYSLTFSSSNRDKPVKPSLSPKKLTNHKREHRGITSLPNNLETKLIFTEDGHIVKSENTGSLALR